MSIRPGWFYHESEDSSVKSAEELFDIYLRSVGGNCTLLLNVPPDRRGRIHEKDEEELRILKVTDVRVEAKLLPIEVY